MGRKEKSPVDKIYKGNVELTFEETKFFDSEAKKADLPFSVYMRNLVLEGQRIKELRQIATHIEIELDEASLLEKKTARDRLNESIEFEEKMNVLSLQSEVKEVFGHFGSKIKL